MAEENKDREIRRKSGEKSSEQEAAVSSQESASKSVKSKKTAGKNKMETRFLVSSSPHVHQGETVSGLMRLVIYALIPASLFAIYVFGLSALRVIVISICSAVVFEAISQRIMKRPVSVRDGSAVLTGLLLAMNLPATSPWWLIIVGTFFAIVVAKQLYGGLGYNPFNPALVGRTVLLISFPVQMTARWISPSRWGLDSVTTPTPLGKMKEGLATMGNLDMEFGRDQIIRYLIGNKPGCLGEVSVVFLVLGGLYLIYRKVITWHIPVSFIAAVWVLTGIFHLIDPTRYADPTFHILTGGLFIGAIFMATDYVTSPVTTSGMLIFGFGCGIITVMIRLFGAYPEGVSFSILLMNAATPLIDRYTKPKVFGAVRKE